MKTAVVVLLAVFVLSPVALLTTCHFIENPKSHYGSFGEARNAGALDPGKWFPTLLPETAMDITEQHNIDTNEMWLAFAFSESLPTPVPDCANASNVTTRLDRAPRWWRKSYKDLGRAAKVYACVSRTELGGYWAESQCSFVVGEGRAVYACDSSHLIPKSAGAQQVVPADASSGAAEPRR
jgi:hypothetical protein